MAASTKKTGKRGILRLTDVFREKAAEPPPPAAEAASVTVDSQPGPGPTLVPSVLATGEPAVAAGAEADSADDTIEGLRRISAGSTAGAGIGPEERAAAVRRIEEEIHHRLARWLHLEDELRTSAREIDQLRTANDASRIAIGALEAQVAALGSERDAALANAGHLRAEVEAARQKYSAEERERASTLERQLAQVREDEAKHVRLRGEAEARAEALRSELATHRDALAGLQANLTDMQVLVEAGESQKAALADRAEELERELADARAQESDLASLRGQVSRLERHNAELVTELEAARTGLETRLKEGTAALTLQLAEAEAGREAAAAGLATAQAELGAMAGEQDALLESLAEREARLAQRGREIEALEQAGAQLVLERDAQSRTIQELHAQLRTHKKLVRVLGNGMGGVNEVAATIRSLDDWVSHQLGDGSEAAAPELPPAELRCGRALESLGAPKATRFSVEKSIFTIGRSADSDMRVGGPYTSRHHARILNEGAEAVIEDLGSANGLLVNDARVARCVLHDGDIVDIGGSRFRFLDRAGAGAGTAVRLS